MPLIDQSSVQKSYIMKNHHFRNQSDYLMLFPVIFLPKLPNVLFVHQQLAFVNR